jgi:hypothetical protein
MTANLDRFHCDARVEHRRQVELETAMDIWGSLPAYWEKHLEGCSAVSLQ